MAKNIVPRTWNKWWDDKISEIFPENIPGVMELNQSTPESQVTIDGKYAVVEGKFFEQTRDGREFHYETKEREQVGKLEPCFGN